MMQTRDFGNGTWSVMARVWNPQKMFLEHPTLINLTKEEAQNRCRELIETPPRVEEIIGKWVYIGDQKLIGHVYH